MNSSQHLAGIFRFGTRMMERALSDVDRKALLTRVAPGTNPVLWLAVHATTTRFRMAALIGAPLPFPWPEISGKSSDLIRDSDYPDPADVQAQWNRVSEALVGRLESMTDTELAGPAPEGFPPIDPAGTLAGFLTLSAYHEGYHMGQISLVRKALGFPSVLGR
jgi:hypothetical protein